MKGRCLEHFIMLKYTLEWVKPSKFFCFKRGMCYV